MPICAVSGACRSVSSGLPYWPRLKLYMKASYVPFETVHERCSSVRHAVGSPSLTAGKCAARIGCVAKGDPPRTSAPVHASSSFHRMIVLGRRIRIARPTAGATSSPAMWMPYPSPMMYAMSTSVLSAFEPSGSSHQRTISHDAIASPQSETVYTFSFTTDCAHTVNAVDPISAASAPPITRCQRSLNQPTSTRSVTRNHMPAATALESAARMFTRAAMLGAIGSKVNTRPRSTNIGLPGGCGMPSVYAAAMYSLVSHIAVSGDSVMM